MRSNSVQRSTLASRAAHRIGSVRPYGLGLTVDLESAVVRITSRRLELEMAW